MQVLLPHIFSTENFSAKGLIICQYHTFERILGIQKFNHLYILGRDMCPRNNVVHNAMSRLLHIIMKYENEK